MDSKQIVVGYDDSPASREALDWALRAARARRSGVLLFHAVKVVPPIVAGHGDYVAAPTDVYAEAGEAVLDAGRHHATASAPDVAVTTRQVFGPPATGVVTVADDAEMVVVGSRGRGGFSELLLGAVSLKVAAHAPCPVVVVPAVHTAGDPGPEAGRIVVGVDETAAGDDVLAFAFEEASLRGVGLTALHAWREPYYELPGKGGRIPGYIEVEEFEGEQRRRLSEAVAPWREKFPDVDVREAAVPGHPAATLVAASMGAELVVIGSRGRGALRAMMLGSVSHAVLHHAHCPVAVIHDARE
jgi:nucleotide-binding universal stress UspA family protein